MGVRAGRISELPATFWRQDAIDWSFALISWQNCDSSFKQMQLEIAIKRHPIVPYDKIIAILRVARKGTLIELFVRLRGEATFIEIRLTAAVSAALIVQLSRGGESVFI
jgi:hypothetical protein